MDGEIILPDSPEAAKKMTVTGWVSRRGFFYGDDERIARYDGSTHGKCDVCGSVAPKSQVWCEKCHQAKLDDTWKAMPRKEWDGKTPLAIFDSDTYFFDADQIDYHCEDHGCKPEDLRLVFCVPIKPKYIYADDLFCDELPEDGSVDDADVLAAIDALNKAVERAEPFSWYPGKVAAVLPKEAP